MEDRGRRHPARPVDPFRPLVDDLMRELGRVLPAAEGDVEALRFFAHHLRDAARSIAADLLSGDRRRFEPMAAELREVCPLADEQGCLSLTGTVVQLLLGPQTVSVSTAARALGVTEDRVEELVADGRLDRWGRRISTASVVRRLAGHA